MKKSLYLYLCSLLGVLLFLILHRVLVFSYVLLDNSGYRLFAGEISSLNFRAFEYFTLISAMLLGAWYGIWVGIHWYEKVYEEKSLSGLVGHLADKYWPKAKNRYDLESKIIAVKRRLETDVIKLENLADKIPVSAAPAPTKKRIVRKKTVKK